MRFKEKNVLGDNFYARGDGTRVYFFTEGMHFHEGWVYPIHKVGPSILTRGPCGLNPSEELRTLFEAAGFVVEQNSSDRRLIVNRTRRLQMYRVWQQGKFRKPAAA